MFHTYLVVLKPLSVESEGLFVVLMNIILQVFLVIKICFKVFLVYFDKKNLR